MKTLLILAKILFFTSPLLLAQTQEEIDRKLEYYRKSIQGSGMLYPIKSSM
ncbi:hypothetical protein [Eisenibacter elegans]|jgi:hypothetical protein|uniref:hypothetical protein n=1 Tax=Eisenibacter elegans TaxID=997 RepID=UPI0003F7C8D6|nr:hypothetical protein [Eisenibacter elegans]